jgi:endo-1,4-beta-D-glucanase Y
MNWEISGCNNTPTSRGSGPASDADIDVAMALFMAACRFGSANYETDAIDLLDMIVLSEALQSGGLSLLKPGNWGGVGEINLSYYSPGYFRVFAYKHAERKDYWAALANDTYELMARGTHPTTGLGPDWMTIDGTQSSQGRFTYYYDAARIPWRLAIDYLWYGTPEAKTYLDRIANFADGVGAGGIGDEYDLNGTQLSSNHNSTFVGGFATATMATDQNMANTFFAELSNLPDSAYFEETLRTLYLTLATGNFIPGC